MVTPLGRTIPGGCGVGWGVEARASPGVGTRQAGVPAPRYITRRLGVAGIPGSRTVEGYPHKVRAPGVAAVADFSFGTAGRAHDLDIGSSANPCIQVDAGAVARLAASTWMQ